jgi:hypothetical protein
MRLITSLVVAVALLLPSSAVSDTLSFVVSGGDLGVSFGLGPFSMSDDLRDEFFNDVGSASLLSGPLLDIDVDEDNGFTSYSFGPGILTLTLTLEGLDGNDVDGTFLAHTLPFSFTVCEGCDSLFGGGHADDFAIDFEGRFDGAFAKALGIGRGAGGSIDFGLEDINGDPNSVSRRGFDHRGYAPLVIETTPVPEPGLLLLSATAAGAWMVRRRRRAGC